MKPASLRHLLSVGLVLSVSNLFGQTNALDSLKSAYTKETLSISRVCEQRKTDALKQYDEAVDGLMTTLKQKGDLKEYLLVESEAKRLVAGGYVPDAKRSPPVLADAVAAYQKAVGSADADARTQNAVLLRRYQTGLDGLIRKLMQTDRIEDAKAVQAERDKVSFELADVESKLPAEKQNDSISEVAQAETWISKDATYTVSSVMFEPLPSLLTGEGQLYSSDRNLFAFHTRDEDKTPFIVIDLGKPKTITKVYIVNRPNYAARGENLALWLSDIKSFQLKPPVWLADKGQDEWTVTLPSPMKARYIKLGRTSGSPFHLKLVKVFGWDNAAAPRTSKKLIPNEAKVFMRHHYLFVAGRLTWHEAKKACEEMGGHLVTITSKDENDFVNNLGTSEYRLTWVGLTDEGRAFRDWQWVTGDGVQFSNWVPGRPDNGFGNEHYVFVYQGKGGGAWDDTTVSYPNITGCVCEWDY